MKPGLSAWAIRRPLPTLVLFCVLTLAGIYSFLRLPVNATPSVTFPLISVTVVQPGAAPGEIETSITQRLEETLSVLPDVRHVESTVRADINYTVVEFRLDVDSERALNDVRAAIGQIRDLLPQTILEPVIQRINIEGGAMLHYVVTSDAYTALDLSWFIDNTVRQELLSMSGVQSVERFGGAEREIRVEVDPAMLAYHGLSIEDLNYQLRNTYTESTGGYLNNSSQRLMIRVPGRETSLAALQQLHIALPNNKWLPLTELAQISDVASEAQSFAHFNGKSTVGFSVWRSKGVSDVLVAEKVTQRLATLHASYPDITITQAASTVEQTQASFNTAMQTLIEGALLTVLVVFIFLRDWRTTVISALAIPLSMLPVFLFMLWSGFTLNNVTLLALILVIGILVDDAIVEVENIDRHVHMGERPYQAALHAADAIALAVLATTLTIIAVFMPISFIQGVVGQYFRQFGLTATVAVFGSLMVARLLTPLMAAYFLRPAQKSSTADAQVKPEPSWMMRSYLKLLATALRHRGWTLILAGLLFVLSILLAGTLPTGFLPVGDARLSFLVVQLPTGNSLSESEQAAQRISATLSDHPDVSQVLAIADSTDEIRFTIVLTPRQSSKLTRKEFELDIQQSLAKLPDMRFQFLVDGLVPEVSIMLGSHSPEDLKQAALRLADEMRTLPELTNVKISLTPPRSELFVQPRDGDAARLGVATETIGNTLRIATSGETDANSARYLLANRQLPVRVRLNDSDRSNIDILNTLPLRTLSGQYTVPLAAVADIQYGEGESRIERYDKQRRVTIDANLAFGSLGQALTSIQALPAFRNLPASVRHIEYGDAEFMQEMFGNFGIAMAAGVLAMFAILILLFHDVMQPLNILLTLPLSLIGAVPALWLVGAAFDMPVIIGMLMLMGIVTKNAILLVDFIIEAQRTGASRYDAIISAATVRARPIIMTTVAMVAGMLPAAIGFGADAGFRTPMAVTVIGGLIASTLLSLVCIPVGFTYLDDLRHWLGRRLVRLTTVSEEDLKQA
ncbi:efflux RND transporter permease subunit [Serratia microhaemolytica]|uniref:efflux RND transporter permease subunit n=1 Tax=Serratia microhaemolytica TaxID=2675110 RepID=UPI000FDF24F5|nr:efflux RND transporter permease subunit [Serratia microhaemolytica]